MPKQRQSYPRPYAALAVLCTATFVASLDPFIVNAAFNAVGHDRYPDIKAPVHLIYGERGWSRPSDRQANKEQLPNAELTHIPDAGHFIALEGSGPLPPRAT